MRLYAFCVCSPTRASLRTCRLPAHVNQMNDRSISQPLRTPSLVARWHGHADADAPATARGGWLQCTAHVGKWHLGSSQMAQLPSRRGFDESFAFLVRGSLHTQAPTASAFDKPQQRHAALPAFFFLWENESRRRHQDAAHTNPEGSDVCMVHVEGGIDTSNDQ
jgi:arylsulfatase A-like enzyme